MDPAHRVFEKLTAQTSGAALCAVVLIEEMHRLDLEVEESRATKMEGVVLKAEDSPDMARVDDRARLDEVGASHVVENFDPPLGICDPIDVR